MESHYTAFGQFRGLSRGTVLANLSILHKTVCMCIKGTIPIFLGMFVWYVDIDDPNYKIFVPEWNCYTVYN